MWQRIVETPKRGQISLTKCPTDYEGLERLPRYDMHPFTENITCHMYDISVESWLLMQPRKLFIHPRCHKTSTAQGEGLGLWAPTSGSFSQRDFLHERIHSRQRNSHENMVFRQFLMHSSHSRDSNVKVSLRDHAHGTLACRCWTRSSTAPSHKNALRGLALADCASIIFGIIGAKKA